MAEVTCEDADAIAREFVEDADAMASEFAEDKVSKVPRISER